MVITDKERKALCRELGVYWPGLKTYGDMLVVLDALIEARKLATPASTARTDDKRVENTFDKLADQGFFENVEDWPQGSRDECMEILTELAAPGSVPQAGITTAGEMRARIAAATDEEMQPLRDALRIAVDHFGSDDSEQDTGVPQAEPPKEEKQ